MNLYKMKHCCRICLSIDIRMYKLGDTAKKNFIESIFKQHGFDQSVHKNHYVCYICDAFLTKCYNFVTRALRAQHVLGELLKEKGLITIAILQNINRLKNKLDYTKLNIHQGEVYCIDEHYEIEDSDHRHMVEVSSDDDMPLKDLKSKHLEKQNGNCDKEFNDDIESNKKEGKNVNHDNNIESDDEPHEDLTKIKVEIDQLQELRDNLTLETTTNATDPLKTTTDSSFQVELGSNYIASTEVQVPQVISEEDIETECLDHTEVSAADDRIGFKLDCNVTKPLIMYKHTVKRKRGRPKENNKRKKLLSDDDYVPNSDSESDDSCCERVYPMTCEQCDAILTRKREHWHHYLEMHKNIEYPYKRTEKRFVCEICGACMSNLYHFKDHLYKHNDKTVRCQQCPKEFLCRRRLTAHLLRVHSLNKYICDYCNKTFKDKHALKLHIRIHTGDKPYKCHICRAGFAHGGNLGLHIRVKHQNRPYPSQEKKAQLKKHESPLGSVNKSKKAPKFKTNMKSRTRREVAKNKGKPRGTKGKRRKGSSTSDTNRL